MSDVKDLDYDKAIEAAVKAEKTRLMTLFLENRESAVADYKISIKHTGGMLTQSMIYAYIQGLNTAFKLFNKKDENEETSK
jgi:hypothetical protein